MQQLRQCNACKSAMRDINLAAQPVMRMVPFCFSRPYAEMCQRARLERHQRYSAEIKRTGAVTKAGDDIYC